MIEQWSPGSIANHKPFQQYTEIQFLIPQADLTVHTCKQDKSVVW